jgi:hypothetical protein
MRVPPRRRDAVADIAPRRAAGRESRHLPSVWYDDGGRAGASKGHILMTASSEDEGCSATSLQGRVGGRAAILVVVDETRRNFAVASSVGAIRMIVLRCTGTRSSRAVAPLGSRGRRLPTHLAWRSSSTAIAGYLANDVVPLARFI